MKLIRKRICALQCREKCKAVFSEERKFVRCLVRGRIMERHWRLWYRRANAASNAVKKYEEILNYLL